MKKVWKRIACIILIVLVLCAVVALINYYPILTMKPAASGKIPSTEIRVMKNNFGSLYFIKGTDGFILIDAGSNAAAVKNELEQFPVDASEVKYILLTHSDSDHVAALNLFPNARIFISKDEMQMLNGTTKRSPVGYNALSAGIDLDTLVPLTDKQELELGGHTIECIQAPGHTPGSMAYFMDGQYMFTGDAFKVNDSITSIHPYTMDKETAGTSIQKLNTLGSKSRLVLTAHYGYFPAAELKSQ